MARIEAHLDPSAGLRAVDPFHPAIAAENINGQDEQRTQTNKQQGDAQY